MIDLVEVSGRSAGAGGAAPDKEGRNMDHLCLRVEPFDEKEILSYLRKPGVAVGEVSNRFGAEEKACRSTSPTRKATPSSSKGLRTEKQLPDVPNSGLDLAADEPDTARRVLA